VSAEVVHVEWRGTPADDTELSEFVYSTAMMTAEQERFRGGYFGYMTDIVFVRVGFAQPCSKEERLDAARVLLQLSLLRGAIHDA
jgi:hypothetical protein